MKLFHHLFYSVIISVSLFSCVATSSTNIEVMKPADITVAPSILKLGIVDRSHPDKNGKAINVLEGLVSGEGLFQDKYSFAEAVTGLTSGLSKSQRYSIFQIPGVTLYNNGGTSFSPILSWELVKELCLKNNVDALLVLEIFDTDKSLKWSTETNSVTRNGITQNELYQVAKMNVSVTAGWRIYDPATMTVVDEYRTYETSSSSGKGLTTYDAEKNLPQYSNEVAKLARINGEKYALRIAPTPMTVLRSYYTGGDERMKLAKVLMRDKKYEEATKLYEAVSTSAEKPKVRGRAFHNIALIHEVTGSIDKAIEFAEKAVAEGNKSSVSYLNTLKQRKLDDEKAKQQLINVK